MLSKFLICLFPPVVLIILMTSGINYYFSSKALNQLAETWLSGKLGEAMKVLEEQETNLRKYGLEKILGSKIKAQADAETLFSLIEMGEQGYIFVVDSKGKVTIHPDKYQIGIDISEEDWFLNIRNGTDIIRFDVKNKSHLAIVGYFQPWDWYVLVADPMADYYGPTNKIKYYILAIGALGSLIFGCIIFVLVRRLMIPLKHLTEGARQIGMGNLRTQIDIHSKDEFSQLSKAFNAMAHNLQKLTVSRNELENEIRQKEKAEAAKEELIKQLRNALGRLRTLEGDIPICAKCKKIRDEKGGWNNLEIYIEKHSEALFTHGLCPECADTLYGKHKWYRKGTEIGNN